MGSKVCRDMFSQCQRDRLLFANVIPQSPYLLSESARSLARE
jgi:hypothetical protein